MSDILGLQSTPGWHRQPHVCYADNSAWTFISHPDRPIISGSIWWEALLVGDQMERRTRVNHPCRFVTNKMQLTLLCDYQPFFFTCRYRRRSSSLRNLLWFWTVSSPFGFPELSAILLEVPRLPTIEAHGLSPQFPPCPRLISIMGTSISASSSIHVTFRDKGLRVGIGLSVLPVSFFIQ